MRFFLILLFVCPIFGNSIAPAPPPTYPTPTFVPSPAPQTTFVEGSWTHVSTVTEHGCGGTVGQISTIPLSIVADDYSNSITLTYTATGYSFVLWSIGEGRYSGSYNDGIVEVTLSFTSPTSYTAEEIIRHEGGCVVRLSWQGTKD